MAEHPVEAAPKRLARAVARAAAVVGVFGLLGLGACGDDAPGTSGTPAEGGEKAGTTEAGSLGDLGQRVRALEAREEAFVRDCMGRRGFTQLIEAHAMEQKITPAGRYDPVRVDPLEFGPYTEEQATRYGMVGTVYLFADGEPGSVISRDAAFDRARADCEKAFREEVDVDTASLVASYYEFEYEVRSEFLGELEKTTTSLLRDRLSCVKDAFPALDVDATLAMSEFGDVLAHLGIAMGELRGAAPEEEAPLTSGEVRIVPPRPQPTYTPTAEEVRLASAYVECGRTGRFVEQIEAAQEDVRRRVLARHEVTILGFLEKLAAGEGSG